MPVFDLAVPILAAPMAGGPTTPDLVVAVGSAGGLGVLAAGYRTTADLQEQIHLVREQSSRPFGVNLFVPGDPVADRAALDAYADRLGPDATALGVSLGEARWEDDEYPAKLDLLEASPVPLVSFTFGCPGPADLARLRSAGSVTMVTVTSATEAARAHAAGADLLCVQGSEAGAHRGSFHDDPAASPGFGALPLGELLAQVRASVPLPLVATGGLMTGHDIAAVLRAGAVAGQLGTAFLCCPEAGTNPTHRRALRDPRFDATAFTRAFTGRTARGLVNAFLSAHTAEAPAGYPWVHHLTRPLRTAAATQGDADRLHLWAGEGWRGIRELPAADLVALLAEELTA
jgi:nitronate monooxygenase